MHVYAKAFNVLEPERLFITLLKDLLDTGYTEENFWFVQKGVIHKVYGDPQAMYKSNGQKQHAIPYWNPTHHNINISPMGLIKSVDAKTREAITWDFLAPGQMIMIPTSYTQGGKYSTLQGVAPQLRPLPRQVDRSLDLSPITYVEWCTFRDSELSKCCHKQTVWQEKGNILVCGKCGQGA